jgi:hypothetical protein
MHSFAQTNLQLFNQLKQSNYSNRDLQLISECYELVVQLFTGAFRPSGKTFIAHLVGTASILTSLQQPITVIAAGLLHAAYEMGEFGDRCHRGISPYRRRLLQQRLGEAIEDYIARYTALVWNEVTVLRVYTHFADLSPVDRDVLLIRLANELEEYLDLGICYCGAVKQARYLQHQDFLILEMARELAGDTFADTFRQALDTCNSAQPSLRSLTHSASASYRVAPLSHCQNWGLSLLRNCTALGDRVKRRIQSLAALGDSGEPAYQRSSPSSNPP